MAESAKAICAATGKSSLDRCYRVMYVQAPPEGGSVTGLYDLVRSIANKPIEPIVLFYQPNDYCDLFRQLGIKVLILGADARRAKDEKSTISFGTTLRTKPGIHSIRQIHKLLRRDLPFARIVARLMRREQIDLVHHNNDLRTNRTSIIAARLANIPQVCHVRWLHDYSHVTLANLIDRKLSTWIARFIYMSRVIEQTHLDLGVPIHKGVVADDPFELSGVDVGSKDISRLRAELGFAEEDLVITNVGRLVEWKGQDFFLEALAQLVPRYPQIKALIVGRDDIRRESQQYYQKLQQMVHHLNLAGKVIFTGFRTDVSLVLAASNIVVHSSSKPEPFGRVVVEGMASGRPVVATAAGGVLEIIEHEVTGLLVPPKNAVVMAQAIEQLLLSETRAKAMGERARQYAQSRFSLQCHAEAVWSTYHSMMGSL